MRPVFRRRHQPRRPPAANSIPGSPAPTTGPGTWFTETSSKSQKPGSSRKPNCSWVLFDMAGNTAENNVKPLDAGAFVRDVKVTPPQLAEKSLGLPPSLLSQNETS